MSSSTATLPDRLSNPAGGNPDRDLVRIADATWSSMRARGILPTPSNYRLWFAFCEEKTPELTRRIDSAQQADGAIAPGILAGLYSEFFETPLDLAVMTDGAQALQLIVKDIAQSAYHDRAHLDALGRTLSGAVTELETFTSADQLRTTTDIVSTVALQAGDRIGALERLLTASLAKIAELHERLVTAEREATRDALTGLANRRMFEAALARAGRQAAEDDTPVSLLLLDIDHFKRVNDTFGHAIGDMVLRLFGRLLLDQIKGRDTAARYGGEEFAILLHGANLDGAVSVAEQVRRALGSRPIVNRTGTTRVGLVTCSIGVAQLRGGEPAQEMLARADRALYAAKNAGRNCVRPECD